MARRRPQSGGSDAERVGDYPYEEAKCKNHPEVGVREYDGVVRKRRTYDDPRPGNRRKRNA